MIDRIRSGVARLPNRPVVPGLIILAANAAFTVVLLAAAGGDASRLVNAGRAFTDPALTPPSLTIVPDLGFDGQFSYRLARAPFSQDTYVAGIRFDIPALRAQRLLYPLLAWGGSLGGQPPLIPWALLILNLVAIGVVGSLSGALAKASGLHALWGLSIAAYPGFVYTLSLDLTEIVTMACLLAGLLALRRGRYAVASVALALAVLSRETAVLVPVGVLLAWGWRRIRAASRARPMPRPDPRAAGAALAALAVFAAWQDWLWSRWGILPITASTTENVRFPLEGLVRSMGSFRPTSGAGLFRLASLALLVVLGVLAVWTWRASRAPLHERLAFLLALALVVMQSEYSWPGATSFLRASTEYWALGALIVLGVRHLRVRRLLPVPLAGMWVLTAASQVAKI